MSAECRVHGTDLLGDQFSGFSCPSCERDRYRKTLQSIARNGPRGSWAAEQAREALKPAPKGSSESEWKAKEKGSDGERVRGHRAGH